jgi:hypothetical protein
MPNPYRPRFDIGSKFIIIGRHVVKLPGDLGVTGNAPSQSPRAARLLSIVIGAHHTNANQLQDLSFRIIVNTP